MKDLVFVTGNLNKVRQVEQFLGFSLEHHKLDLHEIQDLDPVKVLEHKVKEAYRILKKPVLVEDASLVIHALGNLPGTLIKFFNEELGNDGITHLMNSYDDRSATHTVIFGLYDGEQLHTFSANVKGAIAMKQKGSNGFGFDPIFIPDGQDLTRGEMDEKTYAQYQPRNLAVLKLAEYLKELDKKQ